jgi:acyl-CoA dehydrogenase
MDDAEVRRLAREVFAPLVAAGPPGRVNRPLVRALGESGLLGRLFPTPLGGTGGAGVSATELCRLREALARECTEAETALALQGLGTYPLVQSGSDEIARRFVPAVARGEAVAAFALSEPGAGTDAAALSLAAESDGEGWRLTGEKIWISNAPDADFYTVFARTVPDAGARGVTAFVVAGDAPGLSGEPIDMLAPHAIGRLVFDGVAVGPCDVLGDVNAGFRVAMRTLDLFRPSVGAFAVGMAHAALDATVAHVTSREAYGGPLSAQQAVAHAIATMATDLEAARLLVHAAARAYDAGADRSTVTRSAAMAKLFATEAAGRIVDQCVQLHGARALQRGHLLEHLYRDVRAPRIYEGASEVQRTIIAREIFRERTSR